MLSSATDAHNGSELQGDRAYDEPGLQGDRAYDELHRRLISLEIAPGAPIDLAHTSRELGLGRTSLREAVKRCTANPFMEATLNRYLSLSLRMWRCVSERVPTPSALLEDEEILLAAIGGGAAQRARHVLVRHVAMFEDAIRTAL